MLTRSKVKGSLLQDAVMFREAFMSDYIKGPSVYYHISIFETVLHEGIALLQIGKGFKLCFVIDKNCEIERINRKIIYWKERLQHEHTFKYR